MYYVYWTNEDGAQQQNFASFEKAEWFMQVLRKNGYASQCVLI